MQSGDVSFHIHKVRSLNLHQGLEWRVSDDHTSKAAGVIVKHKPFKRVVTLETHGGTVLAELSHKRFVTASQFTYDSTNFR